MLPFGAERFLAEVFAKRDLGLALVFLLVLYGIGRVEYLLTFRLACCGRRRVLLCRGS